MMNDELFAVRHLDGNIRLYNCRGEQVDLRGLSTLDLLNLCVDVELRRERPQGEYVQAANAQWRSDALARSQRE